MLREWAVGLAILVTTPACSLVLDFSNSKIPKDAAIDGPYTADECAYKEPNDTREAAAPITTADTGPAAICPTMPGIDDLDFYGFTVPAGTTKVTISLQFTNRPDGDLDLILYDATGMRAQSRGFGDGETIVCPAASPPCTTLKPGDYVFEVLPGIPGDVNDYTFSLALQ
jgi:hypothetical protein